MSREEADARMICCPLCDKKKCEKQDRKRGNNMTEYKTLEAQQSAAKVITGCIDAINSEKGLPYQLGTLTVDYITKYLAEYRKLIEKDIEESEE